MNQTYTKNAICYTNAVAPANLWLDIAPLTKPVPTLVLQMSLAIFINHGFQLIFRRLRQPRIVSDILTSLVLSPSVLNKIHHKLDDTIMPKQSMALLATVANLGLLYAMFIQGLHADLAPITHRTTKTLSLACSSFVLPFAVGCVLYLAFLRFTPQEKNIHNAEVVSIYWGVITTATSFPTLAPILSKFKLLCSDLGREALSVGLFNDIFTFVLTNFVLVISITSPNNYNHINSPSMWCVVFLMVLYMLFCGLVIRPCMSKLVAIINKDDHTVNEFALQIIFFMVMACGILMDYCGSHFIFGAFVLGTNIPNGIISETLIRKLEDCVLDLLMPLYFAFMGTKIDVIKLFKNMNWVILIAVISKAIFTLLSSYFCKMSIPNGLTLGVLLSAKGLLPLVILNIGHERGHLKDDSFLMLLLIIILSVVLSGPMITLGYKHIIIKNTWYNQRTLEGANANEELRLVACINSPNNVPSTINLLEISNITVQSPASVFALHLLELIGHGSPMLIEHESDLTSWGREKSKSTISNAVRSKTNQISDAFYGYKDQNNATAFVQILSVVSPIDTMHEDICSLAEEKNASIIILSFHKQQGGDGKWEDKNIEFGAMNQNVLTIAPCSVGLLVDRGLRINSISSIYDELSSKNDDDNLDNKEGAVQIAMIYIGGPDDREALTYASRMAGHPLVTLIVIRFVLGQDVVHVRHVSSSDVSDIDKDDDEIANEWSRNQEKENQIDGAFLSSFKKRTAFDDSVCYVEKVANDGDEMISILMDMNHSYDLYIVGRDQSNVSPLIAGFADWSECRELGPLGDVLVTSSFSANASVLVIQQYYNRLNNSSNNNQGKFISEEEIPMSSCHQP